MKERYDIAIIGQGLVGSILGIALAKRGYRIALIEAKSPPTSDHPNYDERSLALGSKSRQILDHLGVWKDIAADATPIEHIHISERGRMGSTRLNAAELATCEMGYVVTLTHLGTIAQQRLDSAGGITHLQNHRLGALEFAGDEIQLTLDHNGQTIGLNAELLIGADGSGSRTRELLGIKQTKHEFGQSAIVANITPEKPHNNEAFERFTPEGPIALLPLSKQRCALVWTRAPEAARATMALDEQEFLRALNRSFGYRLGRFIKTGRRDLFPLSMLLPERLTAPRALLIGNAAHTLHPVAGQGLNLALRDVAVLLDMLDQGAELGSTEQRLTYETLRMRDIKDTSLYTFTLVKLFSNQSPLLSHSRAAGLALLDKLPTLKKRIAKIGMGHRSYLKSALFQGNAGGAPS